MQEKDKKAKKKTVATTIDANTESEEPTEEAAPIDHAEEKTVEEPAQVSTKTRQPNTVLRQKAPLPKAILKRKKAANYGQWAIPAGSFAAVLLLALAYYFYQM